MELWDEPRPLTAAEWDQMLCELTYMGLLEEQFKTIMEQQEDDE